MKRADRRKTGTMRLAWAGRWVFVASVFVASSGVRLSELRGAEPGAAVRDETPADASRLGGLRLAEDRQVEQWLVAARGHLERRESAAAAAFLARVLNADEDSFIVMNSSLAVARDEAWTLAGHHNAALAAKAVNQIAARSRRSTGPSMSPSDGGQ